MVYTDIHLPLPGFIALDWTLMTLALFFVVLRLSLRRRLRARSLSANLSDIFVVGSWLSGLVLVCINTWKNNERHKYIHMPTGQLYYGVVYNMAAHLLHVSYISLYFIYISLWLSKAAFIALYFDLFLPTASTKTRMLLYFTTAFASATFLLHMLLLTLWCNPISNSWTVDGELCSAVHSIASVTISTFTNVATDLMILSVPIASLAAVRLGKFEVSGLLFVFLMGSVSIIAALARFVCLKLVQNVPVSRTPSTCGHCSGMSSRKSSNDGVSNSGGSSGQSGKLNRAVFERQFWKRQDGVLDKEKVDEKLERALNQGEMEEVAR
ncbi:hypothetical protein B0A49_04811 [Cryomyces minteri]|uniref:Rhodopsin domain-containing protein n=1 Tax=Cryomyces minteri TaxID=331657 RepID=A0A4U0X325_9PEZI|nr:hypothetical protein B0A49_04811 [Cryomyces minteri]